MRKLAIFMVLSLLLSYSFVFADLIAPADENSGEEEVMTIEDVGEEVEEETEVEADSGNVISDVTTEDEPIETAKAPSPLGAVIAIVVVIIIVVVVALLSK
jgi:hypothetical protein